MSETGDDRNIEGGPLQQPRVGWVYQMQKAELVELIQRFDLDTSGTVEVLRRRMVTFIRGGFAAVTGIAVRDEEDETPTDEGAKGARVIYREEILPKASVSGIGRIITDKDSLVAESSSNVKFTQMEVIRKSGLTFSGTEDPISFIEKIEEIHETYGIPLESIKNALPIIFKGKASLFLRLYKENWVSFDDFLTDFRAQFVSADFKYKLEEQIRLRTQGTREKGRDFVLAILTLMRRAGINSEERRIDIIYRNLRPEYRLYFKKSEIYSMKDMLNMLEEYEAVRESAQTYKPPPSLVQSFVSETAYPQIRRKGTGLNTVQKKSPNTSISERFREGKTNQRSICWKCREPGHRMNQCPEKEKPKDDPKAAQKQEALKSQGNE